MKRSIRSSSGLRSRKIKGTTLDPMSGIANMSDAMLVLALAFLLAFVAYYKLALPGATQVEKDMTRADNLQKGALQDKSSGYQDVGRVYRDPKTGNLYMVEN